MVKATRRIRPILLGVAVAVAAALVPAAAATAAPTAPTGLYPAPGLYYTSGAILPTGNPDVLESVMAVSEDLAGLTVLVDVDNLNLHHNLTINCHLAGGRINTARDTWLVYDGIREPAYNSTCTENPRFTVTLGPGQATAVFVTFYNPPPPLGTQVRLASLFTPNGHRAVYATGPFNPYGDAAGLEIVKVTPPSGEAFRKVADDGYDIVQDIAEIAHLVPIEIVDTHLLGPWLACGNNIACLHAELPTPYLPELKTD